MRKHRKRSSPTRAARTARSSSACSATRATTSSSPSASSSPTRSAPCPRLPGHHVRHRRRRAVEADNVAGLVFAEEQGSFLVGAAAALKIDDRQDRLHRRRRGRRRLIEKFEAGFVAGAKAVESRHRGRRRSTSPRRLTSPASTLPTGPGDRHRPCTRAAPTSSTTPPAAPVPACSRLPRRRATPSGSKVWAIGVDSDQYNTVRRRGEGRSSSRRCSSGSTSPCYEIIKAHRSTATSSGGRDHLRPLGRRRRLLHHRRLRRRHHRHSSRASRQQIIDGDIEVPTDPPKV